MAHEPLAQIQAAQRVPNTNKPQKGISTFLISNTEYKTRLIIKGSEKEN